MQSNTFMKLSLGLCLVLAITANQASGATLKALVQSKLPEAEVPKVSADAAAEAAASVAAETDVADADANADAKAVAEAEADAVVDAVGGTAPTVPAAPTVPTVTLATVAKDPVNVGVRAARGLLPASLASSVEKAKAPVADKVPAADVPKLDDALPKSIKSRKVDGAAETEEVDIAGKIPKVPKVPEVPELSPVDADAVAGAVPITKSADVSTKANA